MEASNCPPMVSKISKAGVVSSRLLQPIRAKIAYKWLPRIAHKVCTPGPLRGLGFKYASYGTYGLYEFGWWTERNNRKQYKVVKIQMYFITNMAAVYTSYTQM